MTKSPATIIPAIASEKGQKMSRLQRQFNSRIKKIKKLKTEIEGVEKAIPDLRSLIQRELQPLQDKLVEAREQIVRRLDQAWELKFFRNKEKAKLQEIITSHAYELIQQYGRDLEDLYDKHSPISYQEESKLESDMSREMTESMFKNFFDMDIDLDDVDMNDFGQVTEKMFASMEDKAQQQEERQQKRKKTKAQQKREDKEKAEQEHISRTSRAVYTRLVKEFHPDKEPDAEKQRWKTEVMKRVTQAYKQDDFFGLLSLEIELMKGDAHELSALPDQQLKYYNKMLKEQVDELQMQLHAMMNPPPPYDTLSPYLQNIENAEWMVDQEKQELQMTLQGMEGDLQQFSDKKNIRNFLRNYELEDEQMPDEDDFFLFDMYRHE